MEFSITREGHDQLKKGLERMASHNWEMDRRLTIENLPFVIILSWAYSGTDLARKCVMQAAENQCVIGERKRRNLEEHRAALDRLRSDLLKGEREVESGTALTTVLNWVRSELSAQVAESQEDSVNNLESLLAEMLPPAPKVRRDAKRLW
jgi:hypothetical protein